MEAGEGRRKGALKESVEEGGRRGAEGNLRTTRGALSARHRSRSLQIDEIARCLDAEELNEDEEVTVSEARS